MEAIVERSNTAVDISTTIPTIPVSRTHPISVFKRAKHFLESGNPFFE
ncbi:Uncharacterized protein ToN1_17680 [Aromatoleum petrolei]|nr:Uncharacterized protein ToN1_17680 [Aromatoleum petrolei]